jgi:hypothetical protein
VQIYLPIADLPVNIFVILAMGMAVGFISGMFGIGGGFLMTPLLIFLGISPAVAVASVTGHIAASSCSGAISYWRRRAIDVALVCMLLPTAIAYAKYRAVPGYHTWSVKLGSVAMGISVPLLLLFDFAWPFRVAALWQVVCAIDELAITWQLTECHNDVSTAFHAIRIRRGAR